MVGTMCLQVQDRVRVCDGQLPGIAAPAQATNKEDA